MLRIVLTATVLNLAFAVALRAQQVWPGDVNNNGIVNEVDLLYWGLAHGSNGNARADEGADWQAYGPPLPWSQSFANGVNFAFADCNGDGTVDESDFDDAIEENFGLAHQTPTPDGYANATGGNAPRLRLQPSVPAVEGGAALDIALSIEDALMPLDSFYGIALSLSYTAGLLEDSEDIEFSLETNNWIEADNSYTEYLFHETGAQGKASLAITRTNQIAVPAQAGLIGSFSIVIEDIIVGMATDTFYLQIDSVMLITPGFNVIPVVPDTATVLVAKDLGLVNSNHKRDMDDAVRVYPRPAKDWVFLQSDWPLAKAVLVDQLGRAIPTELQETSLYNYRLDCSNLAPGIYWLRAVTNRGPILKKIIISD
ncbi:MAG: hypothetical protein MUC59_06980 [Saprospiraceae bacterium]|jgi:hypothetical protein|nr:hypothetical protein [Saprospiraceae bacterium]